MYLLYTVVSCAAELAMRADIREMRRRSSCIVGTSDLWINEGIDCGKLTKWCLNSRA